MIHTGHVLYPSDVTEILKMLRASRLSQTVLKQGTLMSWCSQSSRLSLVQWASFHMNSSFMSLLKNTLFLIAVFSTSCLQTFLQSFILLQSSAHTKYKQCMWNVKSHNSFIIFTMPVHHSVTRLTLSLLHPCLWPARPACWPVKPAPAAVAVLCAAGPESSASLMDGIWMWVIWWYSDEILTT